MVVEKSRNRLVSSMNTKELETQNRDKVLELIPYARSASQEYSAQIKNVNANKSVHRSNKISNSALEQQSWNQESWDQGPQWNQESWDQGPQWNQGSNHNQSSNNELQQLSSSKNNEEVKILKRNSETVGKQIKIRMETSKAFVQDLRTKMIFLTNIYTAKELSKILDKTFTEAERSNPELVELFKYRKSA